MVYLFDFGLNMIVSYTLQDVEVTESNRDDEGNRPTTVPKQLATLWANYRVQDDPLKGLGLGGGVRFKGDSYGDEENTFKVDEYVLFDAAVHYQWNGFRLAINAENIFDNRHVTSCTSTNACFYGTDRTVIGSISFRW